MDASNLDVQFMQQALRLARRGLGRVSPNPMVGAVIVKDGRVIARGYHHYFGGDHAEVDALKKAGDAAAGAIMYVTLEPCRHRGKTPPCTDAIIRAKIARLVIGMLDPDPRMRGGSVKLLEENGIPATVGVLEDACRVLNETYVKHRTTGLPFVTVKWAQTLDGRIATAQGDSRWISSPESLRLAHRLRATHDAILVGAGTVLKDNPELTTRLVKGRNPLRLVIDPRLRIPLDSRVLSGQSAAGTLVVTTSAAPPDRLAAMKGMGIEVLTVSADAAGRIDLAAMLKTLGARDISSLLVEGGGETITSFIRARLADKIIAIIAPKILGKGTDAVGDLDITDLAKAHRLSFSRVYRSGVDVVVEGNQLRS